MARAVPVLVGRVAALGPIYGRLVPKLLLGNPRKCLVRAGGSGRCCQCRHVGRGLRGSTVWRGAGNYAGRRISGRIPGDCFATINRYALAGGIVKQNRAVRLLTKLNKISHAAMTLLEFILVLAFVGTVGGTLRFLRTHYPEKPSVD